MLDSSRISGFQLHIKPGGTGNLANENNCAFFISCLRPRDFLTSCFTGINKRQRRVLLPVLRSSRIVRVPDNRRRLINTEKRLEFFGSDNRLSYQGPVLVDFSFSGLEKIKELTRDFGVQKLLNNSSRPLHTCLVHCKVAILSQIGNQKLHRIIRYAHFTTQWIQCGISASFNFLFLSV